MLVTVFFICALVAGTIMVVQFVLLLVGIGGDELSGDLDIPDGADFDIPDGDLDIPDGDVNAEHGMTDHGSSEIFKILSVRTIIAAVAFFGLAGLAADQMGAAPLLSILVACAAGVGAMYAVFRLMQLLHRLSEDGTFRIRSTVGKRGSVYVPIPPSNSGSGKIQLRGGSGVVELAAMTYEDEKLPTGAKVEVVDVIGPRTVEVRKITEFVGPEPAHYVASGEG